MLEVPRKLQDKRFIRRLTEVIKAEDAVAIDVVYVNRCWANATSKVCPRQEKDDSINHTLSEIEDKNFEKKKERKKEKRKKKRKERKKERKREWHLDGLMSQVHVLPVFYSKVVCTTAC